ncbi:PREDICTED: annexin-like protein RJ4 [Lupinus angustifolius]|uniref:annexin-like protein RJ4 n=1 Tax=Lupinus angustifolius TaxID=3871 RepID=UPI00092EE9C5|nr:PREDICTED: annexin-like protein RJ4 [Lupinus angustifolius]
MATLIAPCNHSPQEDAEVLQKAFKGWGTDENAVIVILGHRNVYQRQEIRTAYEEIFQEDLVKKLESELTGDFERAVYRWILEPADRDAVLANVALKSGKNYYVIVEISSVLSPEELLAVRRAYLDRYKRSLEEDIASHTSGHLRQLLVGLVTSYKYTGDEINAKLAESEAEILHEAIKEKKGSQEEAVRILSTRSKTQLIATFNYYREIHGTSITKKLLDEASDDFQKALYTAIRCTTNHTKYYEKVLRDAIKRVGTDEDALTRVIVSRAEIDLRVISEVYYKRNSVLLEHALAKETSGDYKNFLLTLLGKDD